jgi:hypothetical protein
VKKGENIRQLETRAGVLLIASEQRYDQIKRRRLGRRDGNETPSRLELPDPVTMVVIGPKSNVPVTIDLIRTEVERISRLKEIKQSINESRRELRSYGYQFNETDYGNVETNNGDEKEYVEEDVAQQRSQFDSRDDFPAPEFGEGPSEPQYEEVGPRENAQGQYRGNRRPRDRPPRDGQQQISEHRRRLQQNEDEYEEEESPSRPPRGRGRGGGGGGGRGNYQRREEADVPQQTVSVSGKPHKWAKKNRPSEEASEQAEAQVPASENDIETES